MVNATDQYVVMKKGKTVAKATEADIIPNKPSEIAHGEQFHEENTRVVQGVQLNGSAGGAQPREATAHRVQQVIASEAEIGETPEHVRALLESANNLTPEQLSQLKDIIIEFEDVFAKHSCDFGEFNGIEHTIDTGDAKPVKQRLRRTPIKFAGEEEAEITKMLKAGVIQPSTSDWASAPVLVRKRDGSVRFCIDYRGLNEVTRKDAFPLPLVDDCLDTLSGNQWFSKLDAISAYWQVKVNEGDRKKRPSLQSMDSSNTSGCHSDFVIVQPRSPG